LDTEATDLDPAKDEIIDLVLVELDGVRKGLWKRFLNNVFSVFIRATDVRTETYESRL
jgi:hypothetical protein